MSVYTHYKYFCPIRFPHVGAGVGNSRAVFDSRGGPDHSTRLVFSPTLNFDYTENMPATNKRFRKRGGKKKKKKSIPLPTSTAEDAPPSNELFETPNSSEYFSGFKEASSLPSDLQSYISHLQTTLTSLDPDESLSQAFVLNPSDDPPPSVLLARNALRELSPRVYDLARDPSASRLLEALIRIVSDPDAIAALLQGVIDGGEKMVDLACERGCRVIEECLSNIEGYVEGEAGYAIGKLGECVAKWSGADIARVMGDTAGSHVFRRVVTLLAGVPLEEPREAKLDDSRDGRIVHYMFDLRADVPQEWGQAVIEIANKLMSNEELDFTECAWMPQPCAAMQALLSATVVIDDQCAKNLAEKCIQGQVEKLMKNPSGARLMERVILCFGASIIKGDYEGKLCELAKDMRANFCVQRILLGLKGRGEVMNAWDELEEAVPEFLSMGRGREGVVLALLRATEVQGDDNCRKRASRCIARACGAVGETAKKIVPILLMGSREMAEKWANKVAESGREGFGLHDGPHDRLSTPRYMPMPGLLGSLIVRCLLRYSDGAGQATRDSMAGLSDEGYLALIGTTFGSRVVEQWMEVGSDNQIQKNAGKIVTMLSRSNGSSGILAACRNSYGAQVVLKCAARAGVHQRKMVMEALAGDVEGMKRLDCGQMLIRKLRVEQYMRKGEDWERRESTRDTTTRLFREFLDEDDNDDDTKDAERKQNTITQPENGQVNIDEQHASSKQERKRKRSASRSHRDDEGDSNHTPGKGRGDEGLSNVLTAIAGAAEPAKKKKRKKGKKQRNDTE